MNIGPVGRPKRIRVFKNALKAWLIPGVLPDGRLTFDRVIVVVHGTRTNRESPGDHLLELTAELARHGLGVLSFDMRGMGESPPAPLSMGALEQRDVLGAVDFLHHGAPPFPEWSPFSSASSPSGLSHR